MYADVDIGYLQEESWHDASEAEASQVFRSLEFIKVFCSLIPVKGCAWELPWGIEFKLGICFQRYQCADS